MSSWAQRVHRRAADLGSVVTSCGHPGPGPYPYRLEKVKFGVPLEEVCKNDIPGPLLVLILKLNKESPHRRDVFRAPGHQGAMKKLIHFLQAGRLVNVDNYSVYTIASVLKKFLRKIPQGIFGRAGENELFQLELDNEIEQQDRIHRLITSLPKYTQHLLVLLFGTFRVIASNADGAATGMTSEALGVSVAPSFFQSCVSDGKTARMEDVLKFKIATKIMKHIIDKFATHDLFGRDNYEYYARVTGRILKVQDEWICSFQYPPPPRGKKAQHNYALQLSLEAEKTWLQCECERWGLIAQEESRSTPALLTSSSSAIDNSALSLGVTPEHSFIESCARLSVSLEGPGVFAMPSTSKSTDNQNENIHCNSAKNSNGDGGGGGDDENILRKNTGRSNKGIRHSSSCSSTRSSKSASGGSNHMTLDELRAVNRYAESTKSLSFLPQVHERQTARMRTRSEWFLGPRDNSSLEMQSYGHYLGSSPVDNQFMGGSSNDIQERYRLSMDTNGLYMMMQHGQRYPQRMDTEDCPGADDSATSIYLTVPGQSTSSAANAGGPPRMFMESNYSSISGSYEAINNLSNNNHRISHHHQLHCRNHPFHFNSTSFLCKSNDYSLPITSHGRSISSQVLSTNSSSSRQSSTNRLVMSSDSSATITNSNVEEVDYVITAVDRHTDAQYRRNQRRLRDQRSRQMQNNNSNVVKMLFSILDFLF